jgi:hypothetical protein
MNEPCVYKKISGSKVIFLILYVDKVWRCLIECYASYKF